MYCPRCAAENINEAQYCRACGANISLVPQAMTGRLPTRESRNAKSKDDKAPTLEKAFSNIFVGVGFITWFIIGAVFFPMFVPFWFWAIFPGFGSLGSGIAQYMRHKKEQEREDLAASLLQPLPSRATMGGGDKRLLRARDTNEMPSSSDYVPPASVTENTTLRLDPDAARSKLAK